MKLDKNILIKDLDLPDNAILNEIIDTGRWSIHHRIIFEYQGRFYQTYYSIGATESQYETPWEHDNEVDCDEVELKEIKVKKWVVKKAKED